MPLSSPTAMVNAAAASTQQVKLGTTVTVLSTDEPIRVFEQLATAAAIAPGRVEAVAGRGVLAPSRSRCSTSTSATTTCCTAPSWNCCSPPTLTSGSPGGDLTTAVRAIAPDGVDKALHAAGDAATIAQLMRTGGTVASTLGATPEQLGRGDVILAGIMAAGTAEKLARLLQLVADGKLRVNVEASVPLDRAQRPLAVRGRHAGQGPHHPLTGTPRGPASSQRPPARVLPPNPHPPLRRDPCERDRVPRHRRRRF